MTNIQTDRVVYMYMYQRVQYTNKQGGLHVHVPMCPIYRQTLWFTCTCTNVSNIQTDIHCGLHVPMCPIYKQTGWFKCTCTNVTNKQTYIVVYMYQCVQYTNRQGGLHVHVPMCPINRHTGRFTCTNVSNMQTDTLGNMYLTYL